MDYKVKQLEIMLKSETSSETGGYGAHLTHWATHGEGNAKSINLDAQAIQALIDHYKGRMNADGEVITVEKYKCMVCGKFISNNEGITTVDGLWVCDNGSCRTLDDENEAHALVREFKEIQCDDDPLKTDEPISSDQSINMLLNRLARELDYRYQNSNPDTNRWDDAFQDVKTEHLERLEVLLSYIGLVAESA